MRHGRTENIKQIATSKTTHRVAGKLGMDFNLASWRSMSMIRQIHKTNCAEPNASQGHFAKFNAGQIFLLYDSFMGTMIVERGKSLWKYRYEQKCKSI